MTINDNKITRENKKNRGSDMEGELHWKQGLGLISNSGTISRRRLLV
jgi:hypothetical protein